MAKVMEEVVQYSTVAPVFEGIPVVSDLGAGIQDPKWTIIGNDAGVVKIKTNPGEHVDCESGAMVFMSDGTKLKAKFAGCCQAGSGEGLFKARLVNDADAEGYVGISNPKPGVVVPLDMGQFPEGIIVQRGAWFGSITSPSKQEVGVRVIWGLRNASCGAALCGGVDFMMQHITGGPGNYAFVSANGTILEQNLQAGETIIVEQNSILGYSGNVKLSIKQSGGIAECCFSGQGCFNTQLTGPGKIWLQSMSIAKLRAVVARQAAGDQEQKKKGGNGAPAVHEEMER